MKKEIFILLFVYYCSYAHRMLQPVSKEFVEKKMRKAEKVHKDAYIKTREHLQNVVNEAFSDAVLPEIDAVDYFSRGLVESDQQVLLIGRKIDGLNVSEFCGALGGEHFPNTPERWRRGVHFKPIGKIPIPVVELNLRIPRRWFREAEERAPTVYICYETKTFLKLLILDTAPNDWTNVTKEFAMTTIMEPYSERVGIREMLIVLDDYWNKRYLLPRGLGASAHLNTQSMVSRETFNEPCDEAKGINQPCCLWEFSVNSTVFHRCFGSVPIESLRSEQLPVGLGEMLVKGGMTRRFLSSPTRVCREVEFNPMVIEDEDGEKMLFRRLDATRCAAFF